MKHFLFFFVTLLFSIPFIASEKKSINILKSGFEIEPIPAQNYNGTAITPEIIVIDENSNQLKLNTDYTVCFENNISVGNASVTVTGIGIYERISTQTTFTINPAQLTVTACPQTLIYGTTPSILDLSGAYDIAGFVNNETEAVLKTKPSVSISSIITSMTSIGTYTGRVSVSGTTADNYTITHISNDITIVQNTGSGYLTFDLIQDKTYGNSPFTLSGHHALGKTFTYESSNPSVVSITYSGTSWTATIHNAGDAVLTMRFAGDDDLIAEEVEQVINIAKASLAVTALPQVRGEGQSNPDVSSGYCLSGFVNASDANYFTSLPTAYINEIYNSETQAGTYQGGVLVSGGEHPNYDLYYYPATLTIETITRTINFAPFCGKTYGDPAFNLSATHINELPVKFISLDPDIISVEEVDGVWKASIKHIGTATIRAYVETENGSDDETLFKDQDITIGKAPLVIRPDDKSRYYGEANPEYTLSFSGLQYGESRSVLGSNLKAECEATNSSNIGQYNIIASGAVNENYSISYNVGKLTINRAALTVKAKELEMVFGTNPSDIDLSGAYQITGFVAGDNEAVLTSKPRVSISSVITSTTDVGSYENGVLVSGTYAQNYSVTHQYNTLTIAQNTGQGYVTFDPIDDKTYGDAPFTLSGRHAMGYPITFVSEDPSVVSITTNGQDWIATILKAGTVTLKAVFEGDENIVGEEVEMQITIKKATLIVSARNQTRAYGQTNPDISTAYDFENFVNASDERLFVSRPIAHIDTEYDETKPVGTYPGAVIVSDGEHPSYNLIYIPGTLTIEPAVGDIDFPALGNKVYGDASFNLSATHVGNSTVFFESLNPEVISVIEDTDGWKATIHKAGEAAIRAYTEAEGNYLEAEKIQEISVSTALLFIRPDDKSRYYGEDNPQLTLSFSGLKYEDTAEDLGEITVSTTATAESNAGEYEIVANGAENSNYVISYNDGTLTVKKAILTFSFSDEKTIYTGNQLQISPASLSGIVGGLKFPITYSYLKDEEISSFAINAGTYTVTASVTGDNNHEQAAASAAFIVDKATPKIQLTGVTTEYTGNSVPVNTPIVTGSTTVNSLSLITKYKGTGETSYPETTEAPVEYGTYEVTVYTDGDANHYPANSKTTISISQKAPRMSMIGASKVYDGTPLDLTATIEPQTLEIKYTYEGALKDGTIYEPSAQAPSNAGNYTVTAYTEGDRNYSAASITAEIEITKKAASIVLNNKSTPYNGTQISIERPVVEPEDAELTITYTGTGKTIYPESVNAPRRGGTYLVKAVYKGNNNYLEASATANLTITNARSPTLTLDNKTVVYNGEPQYIGEAKITPEYAEYLPVSYIYSNADYEASETPPTNAGAYTVTATTPADDNFKTGAVTATLTIQKAQQTITFPEIMTKRLEDDAFNIDASINTGLALSYSSGNTGIAEIAKDGTITINKSGTVAITVMQEGNENYEPATLSRILNITSDDATIHNLTINGQVINVEDEMYYDLLCREATDFSILIETETNATVNTGKLFTVVIDKPMLKKIEMTVTSQDGTNTKTYILTIEKRFDFDAIVKTRWNNTLTVINNPENNGGYRFTSFKWYRNDQELATGQSYSAGSQGELLAATDRYYVEVTSNDFEGTLRSCEGYPNLKSQIVKAYPNPVTINETIYVETDVEEELLEGAVIEVYNISGLKVKQVKVEGRLTPVYTDKASTGTYIFKLKGKDGFGKDLRIVIK